MNDNQAEKHSADEPYSTEFKVHHSDGNSTTLSVLVFTDEIGDECLTSDAIYQIDMCKARYEIALLRAELSTLRKEFEAAKSAYIEEISDVKLQLGGYMGNAIEQSKEIEAAKKAQEDLKKFACHHFGCLATGVQKVGEPVKPCTCGLDELLNNGKDGK
jgi:hypothetical protein